MLRTLLAFTALVAALGTTSPVFAMAGGGARHGGSESVSYRVTRSANEKGGTVSGDFNGPDGSGNSSGTHTVAAAEPLVGVLVGLGLLGARYLRRR